MASYLGDFELPKLQHFGSIFTLRASCHKWKRRCTRDAEALRDVMWLQCTIGYAMKIKKKKMFKSKHLVFAHFSTKTGDFFGIDGKIPMFCHKYFLKSKM